MRLSRDRDGQPRPPRQRRLSSPDFDRASRKKMIEEDSGPSGVLLFKLHHARNLKAADSNGKSDPYVLVRVPGTRTAPWRSKTCYKTLDPTWDQSHEFPGYLADIVSQPLEIKVYDFDLLSFNDPIGSLSIPLWELMRQRHSMRTDEGGRRVASMHFTDVPLEGVDTGTLSFSVSFELKWVIGLLPGTPVHASAAQALRRPPPADATCMELARDRLLLLLGHQLFLWIAILWLISLLSWGIFVGLCFIALYMPMIIVAIRGIARTAEENEADSSDDWYMIGLSDDQLRMWSNICIQVRQHLLSHPHQHQHQH